MASGSPTMNKIERAHQLYRDGRYAEALNYYSEALSVAKTNPPKIALHSNRAACYLKLHDFQKAAEECTSVLELDYNHTGALMLRAQTLVTLKEYHCALFDVNRLIELNPTSEVYRNLHARLKTQLSLATIPEDDAEFDEENEYIDDNNDDLEGEQDEVDTEEYGTEIDTAPEENEQNESETISPAQDKGRLQTDQQSSGWQKIPKPKGHSQLDYSRWNSVEDDSSEEEDDSDDDDDVGSQPQYRFRVKTVGVRAVK
ncbi:uncharacterized protein LOC127254208 [Andrographis paniculata]|uniref:uncharacterized protein LOC127254208 n=1 Tax=Andrographis paniculata TaxID=175694 RepID=UPI0021E8288F|nr:uncharacterized protein LOC127254208 [Andrographis paniculata]